MRIHHLTIIGLLSAALAAPLAPAAAQSIQKVGADIHHTLKKAGNEAKADAKDVGSAAHHTLKTAGNDTKTDLGNATGIHKVGGTVGQAAGDVSRTGKHIGRTAKHSVKKSSSTAHHQLKREGNDAKAQIKP
jgi:hypothetical protein